MGTFASTPGVVERTARIFITHEDVSTLLGCGKSKAYDIVRQVNECAKKKGNHPFPSGKQISICFQIFMIFPLRK